LLTCRISCNMSKYILSK